MVGDQQCRRLADQARAAGLFATVAGLRARFAVRHMRVAGALVAAGFADFGAQRQQRGGVNRTPRDAAGGEGAEIGAVAVELDAMGHHLHVLLQQARGGAMFAGNKAVIQGFEQASVLGVHLFGNERVDRSGYKIRHPARSAL